MAINNSPNAILTLGDFAGGVLSRDPVSDLLRVVVPTTSDQLLRYAPGGTPHVGAVELFDVSDNAAVWSTPAENFYDATGRYLGTTLNFGLPDIP